MTPSRRPAHEEPRTTAAPRSLRAGGDRLRRGLKLVFDPMVLAATVVVNLLALAMPAVLLQVYDRIIPNGSVDTLILLVSGLALAFAMDAVLRMARAMLAGWAGARFEFQLGSEAVDRLLHADQRVAGDAAVGVNLDRLAAIDQLRDFYANQGAIVLIDLPFAVIFLLLVALIAGPLVLVPLTGLALFGALAFQVGQRLRKALSERGVIDDRRMSFIIEILSGVHTLKALAMETLMVRRYERLMNSVAQEVYRTALLSGTAQTIGSSFMQVVAFAVAAIGSMLVLSEEMTVGGLAACTMLAGRALQPMLRAMGIWTHFQAIRVAHDRLDAIFATPLAPGQGGEAITVNAGAIELRNVVFGYLADRPVLRGIDISIEPGECIGITGGNGAGKSTLLSVMGGLLAPNEGSVSIDGQTLATADRGSYVRQVGYLPQHCTLFHGTLLENLTMFRGRRYYEEALRLAGELGLDEYIARLPQGYDTQIDSSAHDQLPGGVRQRIAVIRALIDKPKIILFDEANTALDHASDMRLKELLRRLRGHVSIVLVSYRPSLLELADRRFELVEGRLSPWAPPQAQQGPPPQPGPRPPSEPAIQPSQARPAAAPTTAPTPVQVLAQAKLHVPAVDVGGAA
ncbi:MAG: ATP-binding cassette domain-containing protein [Alphaproteobacteria bacterium]|nr:ATP-binding cassette domain-containing protein [Alphaproteobacteria bacterium]